MDRERVRNGRGARKQHDDLKKVFCVHGSCSA